MAQQVRLRDVAERAGVSIATVSNVMRDWPYVSDATRAKVQAAVRELQYEPHALAQSLRTGRTHAMACILPDLTDPHYAALLDAVEAAAREHSYTVIAFSSRDDQRHELASLTRALRQSADGMLIAQAAGARQTGHALSELPMPAVAIDRIPDDFTGPACHIDQARAAILAVGHLADLGHRRIALMTGPAALPADQASLRGYHTTLNQHRLLYRRALHADSAASADEGYRLMHLLLDEAEPPTALYACSDRLAWGALHAMLERGLRVPADMSLVGCGDYEASRHVSPPLTTLRPPVDQMAQAGVDMLLRLIHRKPLSTPHLALEPQLIIRSSSAHHA